MKQRIELNAKVLITYHMRKYVKKVKVEKEKKRLAKEKAAAKKNKFGSSYRKTQSNVKASVTTTVRNNTVRNVGGPNTPQPSSLVTKGFK